MFEVQVENKGKVYMVRVKAENAKKARLVVKSSKLGKVLGVRSLQ